MQDIQDMQDTQDMQDMSQTRPKVAAITTVWRKDSHADVIISKLMAGYDLDGEPVQPSVDVASLFVDQVPANDLSHAWARRFDIHITRSVRDALTLGGSRLAVDAVLIVAEHGEYPWNEKGQHLYPRRELFEQSAAVMREAGRAVPLFNDKHFSYSWENARWMYDTARDLGMPLMAGSSLPVTYRHPDLDLPLGAQVQEALVLSHGPTESYGFHALETLQCMVEYRGPGLAPGAAMPEAERGSRAQPGQPGTSGAGGETGVVAVETLHGDAFWHAWDSGRFPLDLYEAALATAEHQPGTPREFLRGRPGGSSVPGPHPPLAFLVEYADGLRATVLNLDGYVRDFAFAARLAGDDVVASAFKLEGQPPRWHFNFLAHHVERFFITGRAPYPVERTLLTTGTLAALMDAGHAGRRLETPHLAIRYQPPAQPWRRSRGRSLPPHEVWGFGPDEV